MWSRSAAPLAAGYPRCREPLYTRQMLSLVVASDARRDLPDLPLYGNDYERRDFAP
jgi:hypothetical protein